MRKLILFWVLITAYNKSQAQNLNVAYHSYSDYASNLVSINSKYFYSERVFSAVFGDSTYLVGLNSDGTKIFRLHLAYYQAQSVVKIQKTLDNCLWVVGNSSVCDTKSNAKNFIYKVDTNGVIKFQTTIPVSGWPDFFSDGFQHPDSSFYLVSDSALIHYSKGGQFISKVPGGLRYPNSAVLLNNGNIFVNGQSINFVLRNMEISISGIAVNSQNASSDYKLSVLASNGTIYGMGGGLVEKTNALLQTTNSTSTTLNPDISITSFAVKNDSVFFAGRLMSSKIAIYGVLDQNLNPLYMSQAVYKNVYPTGITIDNQNKINIIAPASSTLNQIVSFTSFYQFPITGNFLSTPDVGVKSYSVIYAGYNASQSTAILNLKVMVQNFDADTVKSFYLNHDGTSLFCGYRGFHKLFNTVISPYGSVAIETGDFQIPLSSYNYAGTIPTTAGDTFTLNVCLFTTVPNQKSDSDISNDRSCQILQVTVTSINENTLSDVNAFKIYPNPFNNKISIEGDVEIEKIILFNATGNLVKELPVNSKTFSFYNSDLANGIYLLKIETEKGLQIKKIVKQ